MADERGAEMERRQLFLRGDPSLQNDEGAMMRFERAVAAGEQQYWQTRGQGYQEFRDIGGGGVFVEQPYNIQPDMMFSGRVQTMPSFNIDLQSFRPSVAPPSRAIPTAFNL